jgi:hypothetical protein
MSLFFSFPLRLTLLLMLFLTACSQAATPTPPAVSQQPTFPAVVTFTPSAVPSPTATATPSATPDRVATALARPTRTPRPTFTPTASPTATATPLPIVWSEQIPEVIEVPFPAGSEMQAVWSPTANTLAYIFCPHPKYPEAMANGLKGLGLAQAPTFQQEDITPAEFICSTELLGGVDVYWHINGQNILYTQPFSEEIWDADSFWLLSLTNRELPPEKLNFSGPILGKRLDIGYWLSENQFIFTEFNGGIAYNIYDLAQKQVVLEYGRGSMGEINNQQVIFDPTDGMTHTYIKYLVTQDRKDFPRLYDSLFYSDSYGWLPHSNQLLVITSNHPTYLSSAEIKEYFPGEQTIWDLQVWDVDTDEVTLLMPNIGSGVRFSADKQFLSRVTPENELQLLRFPSFEVLFSQTVAVDSQIERPLFIQNGRYFTFEQVNTITSSRELFIYDLTQQKMGQYLPNLRQSVSWNEDKTQFLYQTTAGELFWSAGVKDPTTLLSTEPLELTPYPLWSPAGDKVLYQIDQEWFVATPTGFYPLTVSGGQQLGWPEWSFDGSYLSFRYRTGLLIVSLNRPEGE